ncbi:hypothetical protein CWO85_01385 [Candidatus Phytoplasma ziziphi]|uniref:Uncharacterized protein n=1 Tax=Ziziphus jujuba witches'-broom phytoplasma TaxID=135727 RepID=A0A660HMH3_ZIZJU|nr:hypothetical protein CWO85_01385 [Candidatus Phytoplasma ziziphi]
MTKIEIKNKYKIFIKEIEIIYRKIKIRNSMIASLNGFLIDDKKHLKQSMEKINYIYAKKYKTPRK